MSDKKIIKNLRIPLWAEPLRVIYRLIKRFLPNKNFLKQVDLHGIKYLVWANEDIGKKLIVLRSFEKFETDTFKRLVKKGDICFDVGGNVGYYALNLAKFSGPTGKVYVFEPIVRNALMIKLALELNGFENVDVVQAAVSDSIGTVTLTIPSVDGAYAYINSDSKNDGTSRDQIADCVTLDTFIVDRGVAKIDIMKIDVEGAESLVLGGGHDLFKDESRKPRVIMIEMVSEFLERFDGSITEIVVFLNECGYQPFYAKNSNELIPYKVEDHDQVFNVFFLSNERDAN